MARRKTGPGAWVRESNRTKKQPNLKTKDRRWEVVYEDPADLGKRRTKGGLLTMKAAQEWRDDFIAQVKRGEYVDPMRADVPFQEVARAWLDSEPFQKANTRRMYDHIINGRGSLLRKEFGATRLGDISHQAIRLWIAKLSAERSASTVRHHFYTLRKVMAFAVAEGLLLRDPSHGVKTARVEKMETTQAKQYALTMTEVARLIDQFPEPWDMYVRLLAWTGMRPEEAAGLQLCDVLDECRAVQVRRVLVRGEYEHDAKTPKSHRTIDVDTNTADHLAAYIDRHRERALRWFTEHPERDHPGERLPLFVGVGEFKRGQRQRKLGTDLDWLDFSKPMSHGWFYMRYWKAALEKAGLPGAVRAYDLRHAHISWLVERLGQPGALTLTEITERVGHASAVMTLSRYAHAPRDADNRRRNALDAIHADAEPANVTRLHKEA